MNIYKQILITMIHLIKITFDMLYVKHIPFCYNHFYKLCLTLL